MFSFGFKGDDYDDDEDQDDNQLATSYSDTSHAQSLAAAPRELDIESLLEDLPLTIAYSHITLPAPDGRAAVVLPRREIWDVKHQLMAHDVDGVDEVLSYLGSDDLISGVYEGGFKTWECSIDLASHTRSARTVVELGCGSGLPSLAAFTDALQHDRPITLILQDYNDVVLRYLTLPNLLLAWCRHAQTTGTGKGVEDGAGKAWEDEGEIEVDAVKDDFLAAVKSGKVSIRILQGGWGREMAELIGSVDLLLASETIYNEASLPHFIDTIARCVSPESGVALIAAKSVYFGVGGGVESFKRMIPATTSCRTLFESGGGIKRVILELRHTEAAT